MIGLVVSNLSNRLKQLAQEKRISVRALERIMHVANGYVSRIGETMGVPIRLKTFYKPSLMFLGIGCYLVKAI